MNQGLTLRPPLEGYAGSDPLRRAITDAVAVLAQASMEISDLTCRGALAGIIGQAQGRNSDGDVQMDLDVRSDRIIRAAIKTVSIAAFASEETAELELLNPAAPISIAVDP